MAWLFVTLYVVLCSYAVKKESSVESDNIASEHNIQGVSLTK